MTYKELLNKLLTLNTEELNQDVTVFLTDEEEYIAVSSVTATEETDVLDAGHIILNVSF